MENEEKDFIPPNRLRVSYQYGMDGRERELSIHRIWLWGLLLLLVFLVISTISLLISYSNFAAQNAQVNSLRTENTQLKVRLEKQISTMSSTLDSINVMLDSLRTGRSPVNETEYPFVGKYKDNQTYIVTVDNRLGALQVRLDTLIASIKGEDEVVRKPISKIGAPSIYPCFGRVSDGWGLRLHPIHQEMEFHFGIDFSNDIGTAIYATAAGIVKRVGYDEGYGKFIRLDHENGYETMYAHLYSNQVREGDRVYKGQIIGLMGSSGLSTGPHLHYEVIAGGEKVNPSEYLNFIDETIYAYSNN
jgi:murein DD-endopeptidase MepM/ murein hydrolase activator NlpD